MKRTLFFDLGTMPYREAWAEQERLLESIKAAKEKGEDTESYLLFVDHPHVYTLGKSGDEANMLVYAARLRAEHAEFVRVDRGGDITYHGPGQLVVYPVIDMANFGVGVKDYVDRLEEVVIRTVRQYGIAGERLAGATGVWVEPHSLRARKICAIGIRCSRFVTMHGFALNVNTDLDYFHYINPCGFRDKGVTSIAREIGREVPMPEVKKLVKRQFEALFGMELD